MEEKKNEDFFEKAGHRTIFHELINSEILPPQEKQTIRVIQEAGAMVGAGGESTSQVLTALTYALIANPDKLRKLREELRTVMPHSNFDAPSLKQLEKLPYLVRMPVSSYQILANYYLADWMCQGRLKVRYQN